MHLVTLPHKYADFCGKFAVIDRANPMAKIGGRDWTVTFFPSRCDCEQFLGYHQDSGLWAANRSFAVELISGKTFRLYINPIELSKTTYSDAFDVVNVSCLCEDELKKCMDFILENNIELEKICTNPSMVQQ